MAYTDAIHAPIMIVGSAVVMCHRPEQGRRLDGAVHGRARNARARRACTCTGPIDDPSYPFWGIILWGDLRRHLLLGHRPGQRPAGARRENLDHARWGAMFAVLLKLTPVFIFALPGVIALALYPGHEPPRRTFVRILNNLLPDRRARLRARRPWSAR